MGMKYIILIFFLLLVTKESFAQYGACGNDLSCGDNNSPFYDPNITPMVRRMDKEKLYQNEQYRQSQEMSLQEEQLEELKKQNQLLEEQNQMLEQQEEALSEQEDAIYDQESRMDDLESRQDDLE